MLDLRRNELRDCYRLVGLFPDQSFEYSQRRYSAPSNVSRSSSIMNTYAVIPRIYERGTDVYTGIPRIFKWAYMLVCAKYIFALMYTQCIGNVHSYDIPQDHAQETRVFFLLRTDDLLGWRTRIRCYRVQISRKLFVSNSLSLSLSKSNDAFDISGG